MSAEDLSKQLQAIAGSCSGRLGICVRAEHYGPPLCVRGNETFPLQSVMKLLVGAAVLSAVDAGTLLLSDQITLTAKDISPGPEELANRILREGRYQATVEELLTRAVADSDSTSVDTLIEKLGGIGVVQSFLNRHELHGLRIDRLERELQADSVGLPWRSEFSDLTLFEKAVSAMEPAERTRAWEMHIMDHRDKGTPVGIASFLNKLLEGTLLSETSTHTLLSIMESTTTGKNRLRAGLPPSWKLAHKTGTGRTWNGVVEAIHDVGIVTNTSGERTVVVVLLAEYRGVVVQGEACIASVTEALYRSGDYLLKLR